jgi:catechol 2,3-dioxygenase-like lactoylglutathione lyase family enzyme
VIQLNHTIVMCRDKQASADYLTRILGLAPATPWGPFMVVPMDNGVSLDFHELWDPTLQVTPQHYAFLVDDAQFDASFAHIDGHLDYWADPRLSRPGEINDADGGRGVYFRDPDGHLLELITRPYGSGS